MQRLPYPDKENPDPRGDLDKSLEVSAWTTPTTKRYAPVTSGAPSWWRGEEEATDEFLRGMGVQSLDQLRR